VPINFRDGVGGKGEDLKKKFWNTKLRWKDIEINMTQLVWPGSKKLNINTPKFLSKKKPFGNRGQKCIG
jgi:hypothetical protein